MYKTLPEPVSHSIDQLMESGRTAWQAGDLVTAEADFLAAWKSLPEPKNQWDYYPQSLSRGLVLFYQKRGDFDQALTWLETMRAVYGQDPVSERLVEMMAGAVYFEKGDLDTAFAFFKVLYEKDGKRAFEDSDKRYLRLVQQRLESKR